MRATRAVGVVGVVTTVTKMAGFAREMVIARTFGAGLETDAFRVAQGAPNIFFACVGAALATVLVPIFTRIQSSDSDEAAFRFASRLQSLALAVTGIVVVAGLAFTPAVVLLFAPGLSPAAHDLSVSLTRVMLFGLPFSVLAYVAAGTLQSLGEFAAPAAQIIPLDFIVIGAAFLFAGAAGISALAWAMVIGFAGSFLIQLPSLLKKHWRFKWDLNWHDETIRQAGMLVAPVLVGTALLQVNTLAEKGFASLLPVGCIFRRDSTTVSGASRPPHPVTSDH